MSIERAWFSSDGIVLDGQHHRVSTHEPRDVVNVPVRVVADTAFAKPDRVLHPEPFREDLFVVLPSKAGIADLDITQQPFLGYEEQPLAVDLDTAAFEDYALAGVRAGRLLASEAGEARHEATHFDVVLPVRILRPTVERPVQKHDVACGVDDTCRRRVTQPHSIRGHQMKRDPVAPHVVSVERRTGALHDLAAVTENLERFVLGQDAGDFRVHPRNHRAACPANRVRDAATKSTSLDVAPIRRAS